jgi:hypothetical protein
VRIIKIGAARNIDKKVNVGLSFHVSLHEFIREQPADPNHFHYAMDVDNSGCDGKPVIILVFPKHFRAAESVYTDFTELVKLHSTSPTTGRSGHVSSSSATPSHDRHVKMDFLTQQHTIWKGLGGAKSALSSINLDSTSDFQTGGTATSAVGAWCIRVLATETDPSGMGRWSCLTFIGRQNHRISVITGY